MAVFPGPRPENFLRATSAQPGADAPCPVHPRGPKAEALKSFRQYVAKRVNMTDYPSYRPAGYDCGSGPTESLCGTLTARLKGRSMHWDNENAEAIMALGTLYYYDLWQNYRTNQRAA